MADTSHKKKSGPDWRPMNWVNKHEPRWQKIADVYEACSTDALKSKYLKQPIGEKNESYQVRLQLASMSNDLKEGVQSNAGLMSEFDTEEETPTLLLETQSNVDKQGNSLSQYIVNLAASVMKNECVLLGCHIEDKEVDNADLRLPYFSIIDIPEKVYAPCVRRINGTEMLTRIAIRSDEEEEEEEGFALETEQIFRVYRLRQLEKSKKLVATIQKYQKEDKAGSDWMPESEEKILTDAKGEPLNRLPFVWLGIDPDSRVGCPGIPPYYSMAEKLIRIFNLESELDAIQRKVNIPIPTQEHMGAVPVEPEDIVLGSDQVWHHGFGTKVGFAEPTGSAITISEARIQALKAEVKEEREKFLGIANQTATAALLDAGQVQMTIQTIAQSIESAMEELFKLWALMSDRTYTDGDPAGGIRISLKFLKPPVNYQDVLTLAPMFELGVFQDMYEVRAKAKEIGYLTNEIIEDADEMRERAAMEPRRVSLDKAVQNGQPIILG